MDNGNVALEPVDRQDFRDTTNSPEKLDCVRNRANRVASVRPGGADVTPHARKYGKKVSRPIPVWNGILDHYLKIGPALWVFLVCIDKVTMESDGLGWVLGKSPVKVSEIAAAIPGIGEKTVRSHLARLARHGYIKKTRTPYGFVIGVVNSKKFDIWRAKENGQKARSDCPKDPLSPAVLPDLTAPLARNKEDKAVDSTEEAAASRRPPANSPFWKLLGLNLEHLPREFVRLCEGLYLAKNGQLLLDFVGVCMDSWQGLGNKIPGPFVRAATALRERHRNERLTRPPAFLPEVPFKAKGAQCPV
jgi:hypothetical protein